jgi:calpain-15
MMFADTSKDGAQWLPILEKVYAKISVNYEKMGLGWMDEAMRILTGAPSEQFRSDQMSSSEIWTIIMNADKKNYALTAATQKKSFGLVPGHAYSLLGCYELKDSSGRVVEQLVHMRNPWAKETYTGPWNDSSRNWTEDYKR